MKGKTKCPSCHSTFTVDIANDGKRHEITCPECETKFTVKPKPKSEKTEDGCYWEEHGEPRKTVLSSIKPRTDKPQIVFIILICVFAIGLTTAIFSETFIESSMDAASAVGLTGSVEVKVTNETNSPIRDVSVSILNKNALTDQKGRCKFNNIEPGLHEIIISKNNYEKIKKEILVNPFSTSSQDIDMNIGSGTKEERFRTEACSIIIIIFSIFALLAAIVTYKRCHLDVAIVGSLIGILTIGFFMVGSILSIIALVLILMSRDEFENGKKGKIF